MNKQLFEGELVRLTAPNLESDPEILEKWWRDTAFSRLLDSDAPQPWSKHLIKKEIEEEENKHDEYGFMIRTLEDDRLIGFVGLGGISWSHGNTWVGIGIGEKEYWGRGYGTDAMRIVLRYAFTELNLHRVSLGVFEYNPRARRSYEKVGFKAEGRRRGELFREGRRWDGLYMGILREEWEKERMKDEG